MRTSMVRLFGVVGVVFAVALPACGLIVSTDRLCGDPLVEGGASSSGATASSSGATGSSSGTDGASPDGANPGTDSGLDGSSGSPGDLSFGLLVFARWRLQSPLLRRGLRVQLRIGRDVQFQLRPGRLLAQAGNERNHDPLVQGGRFTVTVGTGGEVAIDCEAGGCVVKGTRDELHLEDAVPGRQLRGQLRGGSGGECSIETCTAGNCGLDCTGTSSTCSLAGCTEELQDGLLGRGLEVHELVPRPRGGLHLLI